MENLTFFEKFYLDKEKDIIVNLYRKNEDELVYILKTPNHNTGNLITNLARICKVKTEKNENDMKIIKGVIQAGINGDNEEVYILRLGGIKIANIYPDGKIFIKATIPAIAKTLMSQTKNYNLDINKTIVKSYILKKHKFRTDLHTHMNANLTPDMLIALGIKHQIKYPLYYIKKINLKITEEQKEKIMRQREKVEKNFVNSELKGKYLTRKIDDNTFLNFADLILNNIENAEYNIHQIRKSLAILKDGQAVFTNLEKLYLYRYVFCKGIQDEKKIKLVIDRVKQIPDREIKITLLRMLGDNKITSKYKNNSLFQDKLLWIAREYKKQGIKYVEIADTTLVKPGEPAIKMLEEVHEVMPKIEKETDVIIRFLAGIRRIPLTIVRDVKTSNNYLRENLDILKAVAKDPYVVGSDFIGEEINDISELKPAIKEIVNYVTTEDSGFTIRIHAGENDSLKDNVRKSIECVKESLEEGNQMPRVRIGHGLYIPDLKTKEGKELIKLIKETGTVLEFQLSSNVRLNNLTSLKKHPIRKYLKNNIKCVQGTDGCGAYGIDAIDEQLALQNLLELSDEDFEKMRAVEDEIINDRKKYFKEKSKKFEDFLNGRSIRKAILEEEENNILKSSNSTMKMRITNKINSREALKEKIKALPLNKTPIVIAGASFNSKNRETKVYEKGKEDLKELVKKVNPEKAYFVIGHKVKGYEAELLDIIKKSKKKIEVYAIIPAMVYKTTKERLENKYITGVCISIESEGMGIYKSFNYEIFERIPSIVIAFDGNSAVANLVQEAKNGKAKAKIYVNEETPALKDKANSLEGYVVPFTMQENITEKILEENVNIK